MDRASETPDRWQGSGVCRTVKGSVVEARVCATRHGDLDRLGPTVADLIRLTQRLQARSIRFTPRTETIDTQSPTGRLVSHMFGALAEFARNLSRERALAGL